MGLYAGMVVVMGIIQRMIKNLDSIPTSRVMIILLMPTLARIVGAKDVALVWTVILWGLLIYIIIKTPVENS